MNAKRLDAEFAIMREVCIEYNVEPTEIWRGSKTRIPRVTQARGMLAVRFRDELGLSYPQIARMIGCKDHTGVLYAVRRHKERVAALSETVDRVCDV